MNIEGEEFRFCSVAFSSSRTVQHRIDGQKAKTRIQPADQPVERTSGLARRSASTDDGRREARGETKGKEESLGQPLVSDESERADQDVVDEEIARGGERRDPSSFPHSTQRDDRRRGQTTRRRPDQQRLAQTKILAEDVIEPTVDGQPTDQMERRQRETMPTRRLHFHERTYDEKKKKNIDLSSTGQKRREKRDERTEQIDVFVEDEDERGGDETRPIFAEKGIGEVDGRDRLRSSIGQSNERIRRQTAKNHLGVLHGHAFASDHLRIVVRPDPCPSERVNDDDEGSFHAEQDEQRDDEHRK